MESQKLSSVVQAVTAISVLIGLGLVIWELQQVKTLTRAQLTSESTAIYNSIFVGMLGEDAAAAVAKACSNPEELTLREAKLLDNYYLANVNVLARLVLHSDRDGVYEKGYWRQNMWYLNPILESQYGREWLRERRTGWPYGLLEAMQSELENADPPWCEAAFSDRIIRLRSSR